ncbi:MAG: hypothetical protein DCC75_06325 [Proteobacteria bacterium]|nr:MAG: hypothetical protein DCC75_06325 [Pseudomonadota bacterium]
MTTKKSQKQKVETGSNLAAEEMAGTTIRSKAELKVFLQNVRDKMAERSAAPVFALSAMNHILNLPEIYSLMDNENKEIARDVWLRLRQGGLQLRNPPLLFAEDEEVLTPARG